MYPLAAWAVYGEAGRCNRERENVEWRERYPRRLVSDLFFFFFPSLLTVLVTRIEKKRARRKKKRSATHADAFL